MYTFQIVVNLTSPSPGMSVTPLNLQTCSSVCLRFLCLCQKHNFFSKLSVSVQLCLYVDSYTIHNNNSMYLQNCIELLNKNQYEHHTIKKLHMPIRLLKNLCLCHKQKFLIKVFSTIYRLNLIQPYRPICFPLALFSTC